LATGRHFDYGEMQLFVTISLFESEDGFVGPTDVALKHKIYRWGVQFAENKRDFDFNSFNGIVDVDIHSLDHLAMTFSCCCLWGVDKNDHFESNLFED
jgi:hypothetical protein